MIDIGANLTHDSFAADLDAVLDRSLAAGVSTVVVTGTSVASSTAALQLCHDYPRLLHCTAGVHPHDAATVTARWLLDIETIAAAESVCAIGETGLDFNRNYSPPAAQRAVFSAQLELAARLELPVFVHDRDSKGEVAEYLRRYRDRLTDVVVHCFTGSRDELDTYLHLGCHIGITGWICDERRGADLNSLVIRIPNNRLLIETDAPYLLPRMMTPKPSSRRNEPAHLPWVARQLAHARAQPYADVCERTAANAARVFGLSGHPG